MAIDLPPLMGTVIVVCVSIAVLAAALRRSSAPWAATVWMGYSAHLLSNLMLGVYGPRGNDAKWYYEYAAQQLDSWQGRRQAPPPVFDDRELFIDMVTASFWAFGPSILPLLALSGLAVALLGLVGAHIVQDLGGTVAAQRLCLWLIFLMPVLMVWGKDLLREPYMFLFSLTACYGVLRGVNGRGGWLLWTVVPLVLLYGFRSESALLLGVALLPVCLVGVLRMSRLLVWLLIGTTLVYLFGMRHIEDFVPSVEVRAASRAELAAGSTGLEATSTALIEPGILARVLLGPFPWEWAGSVAPLMLDAIFLWGVLWYTVVWIRSQPSPALGVLVVPAIAILIATSFAAYNYGLLVRIRAQGIVLLIPLAALGWQSVRGRLGVQGREMAPLGGVAATVNRLPPTIVGSGDR